MGERSSRVRERVPNVNDGDEDGDDDGGDGNQEGQDGVGLSTGDDAAPVLVVLREVEEEDVLKSDANSLAVIDGATSPDWAVLVAVWASSSSSSSSPVRMPDMLLGTSANSCMVAP